MIFRYTYSINYFTLIPTKESLLKSVLSIPTFQSKEFDCEKKLSLILSIRFHDTDKEPVVGCQIVPVIDDNVQLTVEEYRDQLYKV